MTLSRRSLAQRFRAYKDFVLTTGAHSGLDQGACAGARAVSEEIFASPITGATITRAAIRCDFCKVKGAYQLTAPDGRYLQVCCECVSLVIAPRMRGDRKGGR